MKKWLQWNERTRLLLTLELAVCLPASALIGVSVWKLKSMKRDKVVEAAIQRDFQQMLKIGEKRVNKRAYAMVSEVRADFPGPDEPVAENLDQILASRPYAAHVFLYDPDKGLILRSQPGRMQEADFRKESQELSSMTGTWMKVEAKGIVERLQTMEHKYKESDPYIFFANWVPRGEKRRYQSVALFTGPGTSKGGVVLGGLAFDSEFLQQEFFPDALNNLCNLDLAEAQGGKDTANGNPAVMMVHLKKEVEPLAASAGWDGGTPEVERNFEGAFPGMVLAIKYRGTTVEALGERFLRTSFLIIGGLSLFLAGGILLTYLSVAKEMALAKLKSDFVSNVSHELRTPLSLIRLYAETLEMGRIKGEEKYREYYRIIRKESERLSALINNILDFSRIEAGKKEYDFRETNLAELVRNTLEAYRYQIEEQGFAFEQNISQDVPPLRVDREAIARSLLNLVNNALKYSQGEKFLVVKLYRDNGAVKLEVIDRGIGISRNEQPKIFEKFYRVGDPLVHNTKGSGLGLSLVRHIVQAHGGQVWVESTPGHGSKFTIALPLNSGVSSVAAA